MLWIQGGPIACMPLFVPTLNKQSSPDAHHLTVVAKGFSFLQSSLLKNSKSLMALIHLAEATELSMNNLTSFIYVKSYVLTIIN